MLNRNQALVGVLALLLIGFGVGGVRLIQLRYQAGDVYPPYSSLRADPLGTRAFYESLEAVRGVNPRRHVKPVTQLGDGRDATLFLFGADLRGLEEVPETEFKELDRFLREGGRIVATFTPVPTKPWAVSFEENRTRRGERPKPGKETKSEKDGAKKTVGEQDPRGPERFPRRSRRFPLDDREEGRRGKTVSLHEKWGVEFDYAGLTKDDEGDYEAATARALGGRRLPPALEWHTALHFTHLATNWTRLYTCDDRAVLIERRFGRGTLVLAADSYFVSNEALRKARHPELLAWLVGPNRHVLFDEAHLGVVEEPGVAALIRKYRLQGLVAGVVLVAGLFVWKHSVGFMPAHEDGDRNAAGDLVTGRDSAAGFVNLLRRSISPSDIVAVCLNEWRKSCGRGRSESAARAERMAAVLESERARPARERHPVESYRTLTRLAHERSGSAPRPPGAATPTVPPGGPPHAATLNP